MNVFVLGLVLLAVAGLAYVRLAPSDPARWHVPPTVSADQDLPRGAKRLVAEADADMFLRLDRIARATPRTRALAGSVEDGIVTYVTRSLLFGFPDYTTVHLSDGTLKLYARARFGQSDLAVNATRLNTWLAQL